MKKNGGGFADAGHSTAARSKKYQALKAQQQIGYQSFEKGYGQEQHEGHFDWYIFPSYSVSHKDISIDYKNRQDRNVLAALLKDHDYMKKYDDAVKKYTEFITNPPKGATYDDLFAGSKLLRFGKVIQSLAGFYKAAISVKDTGIAEDCLRLFNGLNECLECNDREKVKLHNGLKEAIDKTPYNLDIVMLQSVAESRVGIGAMAAAGAGRDGRGGGIFSRVAALTRGVFGRGSGGGGASPARGAGAEAAAAKEKYSEENIDILEFTYSEWIQKIGFRNVFTAQCREVLQKYVLTNAELSHEELTTLAYFRENVLVECGYYSYHFSTFPKTGEEKRFANNDMENFSKYRQHGRYALMCAIDNMSMPQYEAAKAGIAAAGSGRGGHRGAGGGGRRGAGGRGGGHGGGAGARRSSAAGAGGGGSYGAGGGGAGAGGGAMAAAAGGGGGYGAGGGAGGASVTTKVLGMDVATFKQSKKDKLREALRGKFNRNAPRGRSGGRGRFSYPHLKLSSYTDTNPWVQEILQGHKGDNVVRVYHLGDGPEAKGVMQLKSDGKKGSSEDAPFNSTMIVPSNLYHMMDAPATVINPPVPILALGFTYPEFKFTGKTKIVDAQVRQLENMLRVNMLAVYREAERIKKPLPFILNAPGAFVAGLEDAQIEIVKNLIFDKFYQIKARLSSEFQDFDDSISESVVIGPWTDTVKEAIGKMEKVNHYEIDLIDFAVKFYKKHKDPLPLPMMLHPTRHVGNGAFSDGAGKAFDENLVRCCLGEHVVRANVYANGRNIEYVNTRNLGHGAAVGGGRGGRVGGGADAWVEYMDDVTGAAYYHNKGTKESRLTRPGEEEGAGAMAAAGGGALEAGAEFSETETIKQNILKKVAEYLDGHNSHHAPIELPKIAREFDDESLEFFLQQMIGYNSSVRLDIKAVKQMFLHNNTDIIDLAWFDDGINAIRFSNLMSKLSSAMKAGTQGQIKSIPQIESILEEMHYNHRNLMNCKMNMSFGHMEGSSFEEYYQHVIGGGLVEEYYQHVIGGGAAAGGGGAMSVGDGGGGKDKRWVPGLEIDLKIFKIDWRCSKWLLTAMQRSSTKITLAGMSSDLGFLTVEEFCKNIIFGADDMDVSRAANEARVSPREMGAFLCDDVDRTASFIKNNIVKGATGVIKNKIKRLYDKFYTSGGGQEIARHWSDEETEKFIAALFEEKNGVSENESLKDLSYEEHKYEVMSEIIDKDDKDFYPLMWQDDGMKIVRKILSKRRDRGLGGAVYGGHVAAAGGGAGAMAAAVGRGGHGGGAGSDVGRRAFRDQEAWNKLSPSDQTIIELKIVQHSGDNRPGEEEGGRPYDDNTLRRADCKSFLSQLGLSIDHLNNDELCENLASHNLFPLTKWRIARLILDIENVRKYIERGRGVPGGLGGGGGGAGVVAEAQAAAATRWDVVIVNGKSRETEDELYYNVETESFVDYNEIQDGAKILTKDTESDLYFESIQGVKGCNDVQDAFKAAAEEVYKAAEAAAQAKEQQRQQAIAMGYNIQSPDGGGGAGAELRPPAPPAHDYPYAGGGAGMAAAVPEGFSDLSVGCQTYMTRMGLSKGVPDLVLRKFLPMVVEHFDVQKIEGNNNDKRIIAESLGTQSTHFFKR
jgi:hypothetical protein